MDDFSDEERYVTIGMDAFGNILIVVYTWRGNTVRIISAWKASPSERKQYWEENLWKRNRTSVKEQEGRWKKTPPGKTRITIRLDNEIIEYFRNQVENAEGGNYQTLINNALQEYIHSKDVNPEELLRRVVREELQKTGETHCYTF